MPAVGQTKSVCPTAAIAAPIRDWNVRLERRNDVVGSADQSIGGRAADLAGLQRRLNGTDERIELIDGLLISSLLNRGE